MIVEILVVISTLLCIMFYPYYFILVESINTNDDYRCAGNCQAEAIAQMDQEISKLKEEVVIQGQEISKLKEKVVNQDQQISILKEEVVIQEKEILKE